MPKPRMALAVALALFVVAGCASQEPLRPSLVPSPIASIAPSATPSGAAVSAVVTIETRGGECPNGPCGSVIAIEADGRVHQLQPTNRVIGQAPSDLLEALRIEIDRANFPLIESRRFTDTCPTAYDGQETIYVFSHLMGSAWERIASCEVAIDPNHPLFVAVAAVMRTVTSEGS